MTERNETPTEQMTMPILCECGHEAHGHDHGYGCYRRWDCGCALSQREALERVIETLRAMTTCRFPGLPYRAMTEWKVGEGSSAGGEKAELQRRIDFMLTQWADFTTPGDDPDDPTATFVNVQRMSKSDLLAYARRLEWWIAEHLSTPAAPQPETLKAALTASQDAAANLLRTENPLNAPTATALGVEYAPQPETEGMTEPATVEERIVREFRFYDTADNIARLCSLPESRYDDAIAEIIEREMCHVAAVVVSQWAIWTAAKGGR
jgi:hypothetical protein